ncbi:FAD-dependent monooxygenase [Actinoallomurus sp. NPDC050550]|uniref:FAD-dependent oxidoreductase n=1 Tax=Actinoallomurus sp. NPDC050550 TaxID=3154937 RepID=UPI003402B54E
MFSTDAAPTGVATWQGLIPAPFDLGSRVLLFVGRQGDVGLNPAGDGLLQWLIDVPWRPGNGSDRPDRALAALRARFGAWASPVPDLLETLSEKDLELFPHHRHRVPRRWRHGRCALIGDAVHTMPPILAQGAGQALEDVGALLRGLADAGRATGSGAGPDPAAALRSYEKSRRRQARLASAVSTRSLATAGPRTAFQSETALRLTAAIPDRLATWSFGRLIRGVSDRL